MSHSRYGVSFRDTFYFEATPEELWRALQRTDRFESWWQWMKDVELSGSALAPGSVISFRIDPPGPYELSIYVGVTSSTPARSLEGDVGGDLHGRARLDLSPEGTGTSAKVAWDLELANRAIRAVIWIARPVLLRAQHWAVEVALNGFRRHLADEV